MPRHLQTSMIDHPQPVMPDLQLFLQQQARAAAQLNETFGAAVRPLLEAAEQLKAVLAPHVAAYAQLQVQVVGLLNQIHASIQPQFDAGWVNAITESFRTFDRAMQKAEALGRCGWTVPMNAPLSECMELLGAADDPATVDAAFVDFYTRDDAVYRAQLILDLYEQPRLADWQGTLEEVHFALDAGKYRLVVPTLLGVFEGVASRLLDPRFYKTNGRKRFFDDRLRLIQKGSHDHVMWSATRAFVEILYLHVGETKPKPASLNRHWVQHGRGPADAELADCLRLLQAIYTLVSLADEPPAPAGNSAAP